MKVPTLDLPVSQQSGELYQGPGPQLVREDHQVEQAFGVLKQGFQAAGDGAQAYIAAAEKAQKRADEMRTVQGLSELEKRANRKLLGDSTSIDAAFNATPDPGFLQLKGIEAGQHSAKVLEAFDKDVTEIAGTLNERQRAEFITRAQQQVLGYQKTVEGHTAKQFEASRGATVEGLQKTGLSTIYRAEDPETVMQTSQQVEQSLRKMALSPEDGDAAVQQWQHDAAVTQISRSLADGNIDKATEQAEGFRGSLGTNYGKVKETISTARAARDKDAAKGEGEKVVDEMIAAGRMADGFVNEKAILQGLQHVPPREREQISRLLKERLTSEEEQKKGTIEEWRNEAFGLYNKGGLRNIPSALIDRLNIHDPNFVHRLMEWTDEKYRRAKSDGKESAAAQTKADQEAVWTFQSQPVEVRSTVNVDTWLVSQGLTPSKAGAAHLKMLQREAGDTIKKGGAQAENVFSDEANEAGKKKLLDKKGNPIKDPAAGGPDALTIFRADAAEQRRQFIAQHGREPNQEERTKLISDSLTKNVKDQGWLFGIGKKEVFTFRDRSVDGGVTLDGGAPQPGPVAPPPAIPPPPPVTPSKEAALRAWAEANPKDARSVAILKKLNASKATK